MGNAEQELPAHVAGNREAWDRMAADYVKNGEESWATNEVTWGIYSVPESEWHLLPDDLAGKDAIELGCGTAYVSAWLAKRGANPVGIDNSPKQLETAKRLQQEHGIEFPFCSATPKKCPIPTRRSTMPSANTAPRSGAIPTNGSRKPPVCYGLAES